ncbi:MAG TPA: hypothetical protein VGG72_16475 [Bryobacteraceae bacterium]|jgi:hypothetical protein
MRLATISFFFASVSLVLDPSPLFGQSNQAGYVLAAQGDWKWTSKGNAKINAGDPVVENSTARASASQAKLTIAMLDGTVKSYDCPPLNPCVAAIGPFRKPPDSLYARLSAVGKTFFTQRDAIPIYAMSRGLTAGEFQHAVLVLRDQGTDLSPAIKQLDAGSYTLRLRSLQGPSASYSAGVTWDPPSATAVSIRNLRPGVYELIISASDGKRIGSTPVILATPERAPAQQMAFDEGLRIVQSWPRETDPAAIHNFLSALLLEIGQGAP